MKSAYQNPAVQRAIADIERAGRDIPKEEWLELCGEVAAHFDACAEAAQEELCEG